MHNRVIDTTMTQGAQFFSLNKTIICSWENEKYIQRHLNFICSKEPDEELQKVGVAPTFAILQQTIEL